MEINLTENGIYIRGNDTANSSVIVPAISMIKHEKLVGPAQRSYNEIRGLAGNIAQRLADDVPLKQARRHAQGNLTASLKPMAQARRAAMELCGELATMRKNDIGPSSRGMDTAMAAAMLSLLAMRKQADLIGLMHQNRDIAHLVLSNAALLGLPPEIIPSISKSVAAANVKRGFLENVPPTASLDDMLAERRDETLAEARTQQHFDEVEATEVEIRNSVSWMRSTIVGLGLLADMPPSEIFNTMREAG